MRFCKKYNFGASIQGYKLGWSLAGPPVMTVFCYFFGDIMIDTGLSHMEKTVVHLARQIGTKRIFLTHHHEDHSGNAEAIRRNLGADAYGHPLARKKLLKPNKILPYQKYVWGKSTPVTGLKPLRNEAETSLGKMIPLHTPGHSKDHTVYFLPETGVLFSGDLHISDRIRYFRSDEDIGAQIESLKKTATLEFDTLLCAHYPKRTNGRQHIRNKLEFLENLYGSVIDLWKQGLPEREIFNRLKLREAHLTKWFCFGNVSMVNGVRSVIRHYENRNAIPVRTTCSLFSSW